MIYEPTTLAVLAGGLFLVSFAMYAFLNSFMLLMADEWERGLRQVQLRGADGERRPWKTIFELIALEAQMRHWDQKYQDDPERPYEHFLVFRGTLGGYSTLEKAYVFLIDLFLLAALVAFGVLVVGYGGFWVAVWLFFGALLIVVDLALSTFSKPVSWYHLRCLGFLLGWPLFLISVFRAR